MIALVAKILPPQPLFLTLTAAIASLALARAALTASIEDALSIALKPSALAASNSSTPAFVYLL